MSWKLEIAYLYKKLLYTYIYPHIYIYMYICIYLNLIQIKLAEIYGVGDWTSIWIYIYSGSTITSNVYCLNLFSQFLTVVASGGSQETWNKKILFPHGLHKSEYKPIRNKHITKSLHLDNSLILLDPVYGFFQIVLQWWDKWMWGIFIR